MEASAQETWASRAQFFAAAGRLMRNILVDRAREKSALKNGGNLSRGELTDVCTEEPEAEDVETIHRVLAGLEAEDPRAAQLVA